MLDAIEERMKQDNETTAATQLVKMLGERGFKILTRMIERARKTLGWTFTLPSYLIRIFSMTEELQSSATVATNERTPILALYDFP